MADFPLEEWSIARLQAAMSGGEMTSAQIVDLYLARIEAVDRNGPRLNSIIEVNPDARAIAEDLDRRRAAGGEVGSLYGIPVILKDNIDTADRMQTTAGSLALVGQPPAQDATVAARLRAAGAVILGKANLSEWANFRSNRSSSGWSGRGGQTRNPFILDRNPCGSSSGSAAAVSANLCAAALGTETDGSIVCPSHASGVAGIKPTVGLTSRAGVVPISHSQDTVGPHGRTVADAVAVLGALVGVDERDAATAASAGHFHTDYTQFLDADGLRGARIGVTRKRYAGYSPHADRVLDEALAVMRGAGAVIVEGADLATAEEMGEDRSELEVLLYEFKADLNAYLATRGGVPIRTLEEAIAFNEAHAAEEMPYFGQEIFLQAQAKGPLTDGDYLAALEKSRRLGGADGIDATLREHNLDAIVAPTGAPAWPTDWVNGNRFMGGSSSPAARAGYPLVTLPAGYVFGLPVNITFMGTAWSEPTLIRLAYAFEVARGGRQAPRFLPSL
ncbi:MAG: amidase [Anaerolineae bacterium]